MVHTKKLLWIVASASLLGWTGDGATASSIDVGVEGRTNAYASLAASQSFVTLAWGASAPDGTTDVYASVSRDAGQSFGVIVVLWTAKSPGGTRLLSARSDDGGRSFSSAESLTDDAAGNRGWESIAVDREGRVVAIWLDHRELAPTRSDMPAQHAGHQHTESTAARVDGVERAQQSKLYFGRVGDRSRHQPIAGGVCYCCKTTTAVGGGGAIYAAWRHVFAGNIRDIAFTMSADGGRTFAPAVRVSADNWVLDGCPENGPSLAIDDGRRVHVVWPTLVPGAKPSTEAEMALFYASSADGHTFTARQRLPTEGVPRHPQLIAAPRAELVVAWDEQRDGMRRVVLARGVGGDRDGAPFVRQSLDDSATASYPVIARSARGIVTAWTSGAAGGATTIRVAPPR